MLLEIVGIIFSISPKFLTRSPENQQGTTDPESSYAVSNTVSKPKSNDLTKLTDKDQNTNVISSKSNYLIKLAKNTNDHNVTLDLKMDNQRKTNAIPSKFNPMESQDFMQKLGQRRSVIIQCNSLESSMIGDTNDFSSSP
ncbi:MAG: hypothetical protein HRK26_00275 [Rickettsiaceae bacterium H1]|nr:hypothetical protein [Rickettsiaceae bacterium H1]